MVYVANNLSQVEEIIKKWGKPNVYMKNFDDWQELEKARKCYEWQMSALPKAKQDVERPTDEEEEWFWQKQLKDEHFVKSIDEINKWVEHLPDDPNAYSYTKERSFQ